jgi:hypothetical protein
MATLNLSRFEAHARSDNRPRPYSRMETDEELLARCTKAHHDNGGVFVYATFATKEYKGPILLVQKREVEAIAEYFSLARRIVWVSS